MDAIEYWLLLDRRLQQWFQSRCNAYYKGINEKVMIDKDNRNSLSHDTIFLSGSSVEIGAISRCIAGGEVNIEYDIMHELGTISSKTVSERLLVPVEGSAGYFYLKDDPGLDVVHPYHKKKFSSYSKNHQKRTLLEEIGKSSEEIVNTNVVKENFMTIYSDAVTGPSCAGSIDIMSCIPYIGQSLVHYTIMGTEAGWIYYDHVVCFALNIIPNFMAEWMTADHSEGWPVIETRRLICSRGLHIVAKDSTNDVNTWRVSTSVAESILFGTLSATQRLVYLAFKLLFYAYFKGEECSWFIELMVK